MKTQAIVPHSVRIPGVGWVRFPKELVGALVSEADLKRLWAKYVRPHIPTKPGLRK